MSDQQRTQDARLLRHLGQFWTVANMLSLLRAVLVIPITYLILIDGSKAWMLGLVVVAALTDWLDGKVARWSGTVSDWGKALDPLADKFAAAAVLLALVIRGMVPVWFLVVVLARDVALVLGALLITRRTGLVMMSLWWGKVAVGALGVTVVAALLEADPPVLQACIWGTVALMAYAHVRYTLRFVQVWRRGRLPRDAGLEGDAGRTIATMQPEG